MTTTNITDTCRVQPVEFFFYARFLRLLFVMFGYCIIFAMLATLVPIKAAPINPRFYAFSSYIGPVVNLTFNDPGVLRVVS